MWKKGVHFPEDVWQRTLNCLLITVIKLIAKEAPIRKVIGKKNSNWNQARRTNKTSCIIGCWVATTLDPQMDAIWHHEGSSGKREGMKLLMGLVMRVFKQLLFWLLFTLIIKSVRFLWMDIFLLGFKRSVKIPWKFPTIVFFHWAQKTICCREPWGPQNRDKGVRQIISNPHHHKQS